MGQLASAMTRCLGWQHLADERDMKRQVREEKHDEKVMEFKQQQYDGMLFKLKQIQDIRQNRITREATDVQRIDNKIEHLAQKAASLPEPTLEQTAEMARLLLDRKLHAKSLETVQDDLGKAMALAHSLRDLKEDMLVKQLEHDVVRRSKRAINDDEDEKIDEHIEEGEEFAQRVSEAIDKLAAHHKSPVNALSSSEDGEKLREEAKLRFQAAAKFAKAQTQPIAVAFAQPHKATPSIKRPTNVAAMLNSMPPVPTRVIDDLA